VSTQYVKTNNLPAIYSSVLSEGGFNSIAGLRCSSSPLS